MAERANMVTVGGKPVTLIGNEIGVGDKIPSVKVTSLDQKLVDIKEYEGKVIILSTVLSLETSVCDTETRRFNKEAASLGDDIVILVVSPDLPFAQKRWCGAAGIDKVEVFSDYREHELAKAFGVLIKESQLLARSIFVIDKQGKVQYVEIVKEVGTEPDYEKAIAVAKKLV